MTLIAQLSVNGAPFLVGDVLLTRDRRTGLRANLPLVGNINEVIASRGLSFEATFAQKVNVLGDRLVVAWSGSAEQAERVFEVLSALTTRENLSRDDIKRELEAIDRSRIDQLQLLGLLVREVRGTTVSASTFSLDVQGVEVPWSGTVYAAGSGRDEFLRLLNVADWTGGGTSNEFQVAHALLGALTNEEYRKGNTIVNRWGGGFEAVTFSIDTGRFQKVGKVGDLLHTFWTINLDSPDTAQFLPMFYKTTYWRDALIIRYARFDGIDKKTFKLMMNSLELVPPLLKSASDYDLDELGVVDFSYRALCCHISIARADGSDTMHIIQPGRSNELLELEFNADSSGRLHIPGEISKTIIEEAKARASQR
jgi:hypothetical protein